MDKLPSARTRDRWHLWKYNCWYVIRNILKISWVFVQVTCNTFTHTLYYFFKGTVLGQLKAYDPEGDTIKYECQSQTVMCTSDGKVILTRNLDKEVSHRSSDSTAKTYFFNFAWSSQSVFFHFCPFQLYALKILTSNICIIIIVYTISIYHVCSFNVHFLCI